MRCCVFPNRIRELRVARGLTQQQLAAKLGLARNTVAMYEGGDREPSLDVVHRIADLLGTSSDYLLGCCDEPAAAGGTTPLATRAEPTCCAEAALLESFRALGSDDQREVLDFVSFKRSRSGPSSKP